MTHATCSVCFDLDFDLLKGIILVGLILDTQSGYQPIDKFTSI